MTILGDFKEYERVERNCSCFQRQLHTRDLAWQEAGFAIFHQLLSLTAVIAICLQRLWSSAMRITGTTEYPDGSPLVPSASQFVPNNTTLRFDRESADSSKVPLFATLLPLKFIMIGSAGAEKVQAMAAVVCCYRSPGYCGERKYLRKRKVSAELISDHTSPHRHENAVALGNFFPIWRLCLGPWEGETKLRSLYSRGLAW